MNNRLVKKLIKFNFAVFAKESFFIVCSLLFPCFLFTGLMFVYQAYNVPGEDITNSVPIVSFLSVFMILFFNINRQFLTEKEQGMHKLLALSGVNHRQIIVAHMLRGLMLGMIIVLEICFIAGLCFALPITHYFPVFFIGYSFVVAALLFSGLILSGLFKSVQKATPFTALTFFYVMFGSGIVMPIQRLPDLLHPVVYASPFYHMNQMLVYMWHGQLNDSSLWLSTGYVITIIIVCAFLVVGAKHEKKLV
jgi:ABC-2 type transport system permease protein